MKRFLAILISIMLAAGCLSAMAESETPGGSGGAPAAGGDFGGSDGGPSSGDDFGGSDGAPASGDDFGGSDGAPSSGEGFGPSGGAKAEGMIGSWSMGGTDADSLEGDDYAYDAALYVTADGINTEKSATDRLSTGTISDQAASGIVIHDSESGHNGVIVVGADYTISDADISLLTDADGSDTCDFSGKGAAIAVYGRDAHVTVENSTLHTAGVAALPLFSDDGAVLTVRNSVCVSDGGTLYKDYLNTPDQKLMVAPPWVLGIMGTSRCSNIMGNNTTTNVIDSETSAGAWAVLSTDAGTNMYLNVYNSSLTLNNADESQYPLQAEGGQISETLDNPYSVNYGSGYASFVIGSAVETFVGATIHSGTYVVIMDGGTASYSSLEAGKTYEIKNGWGEVCETYEAKEDKPSVLHSDTFGFMALQSPNAITLNPGTQLDTGYASFLIKTGYGGQATTAVVDGAEITNGGVLIQVMDNDDATTGGMMSATDPMNTNGGAQNFLPYHTEDAGFNVSQAKADATQQVFTFTNGSYAGNIYNGSGSDGLNANALNVTFGAGAEYTGAIASTSAIHVTYDGSAAVKANGGYAFDDAEEAAAFAAQYQNTRYTINEYFSMGHVANLVNFNGGNRISVTLADGAVWNVTGTSLIASLTIGEGCRVVVPAGVTLSVDGVEYTDCELN